MKFLDEYDFSKEEINNFANSIPRVLKNKLKEHKGIVRSNIGFLKDLGVSNYKEIFCEYYDMFLMDGNNFEEIFLKYDKADLIDKLLKNIYIIEHL